jgi:ribonuclease PH
LNRLGERTVWIDCDVIQADGGTRTASITGAFIALAQAVRKVYQDGLIEVFPVLDYVAATSVGIVDGELLTDLNYDEDSRADVDMNVVKTGQGRFVEVQGTAESKPFNDADLTRLLQAAGEGIRRIVEKQAETLGPLDFYRPSSSRSILS